MTEKIIVDTGGILDLRVKKAFDILMNEGKGVMTLNGVDVVVDGAKRSAVELSLDAEKKVLADAVRRAGLTIIENAEVVEPPAQKSTLNLIIADADLVRCDLNARDKSALNHPKLTHLDQSIRKAIIETAAKLRQDDPNEISQGVEMKPLEIEELYKAVSKVILEHIQMMSKEPMDKEHECPKREIVALYNYQDLILKCFVETHGIFKKQA